MNLAAENQAALLEAEAAGVVSPSNPEDCWTVCTPCMRSISDSIILEQAASVYASGCSQRQVTG